MTALRLVLNLVKKYRSIKNSFWAFYISEVHLSHNDTIPFELDGRNSWSIKGPRGRILRSTHFLLFLAVHMISGLHTGKSLALDLVSVLVAGLISHC